MIAFALRVINQDRFEKADRPWRKARTARFFTWTVRHLRDISHLRFLIVSFQKYDQDLVKQANQTHRFAGHLRHMMTTHADLN